MFEIIKKMFIVVLTRILSVFNHTKCVLSSSQEYMTQPTLINLNLD